jgi:transposase
VPPAIRIGQPDCVSRPASARSGSSRRSPGTNAAGLVTPSGLTRLPGLPRPKAAAADSIAFPELDAEVAFEVGLLLDQYDLLERQIATADRRVAELPDGEAARRLQTIPRVGPAVAATLLAEIGDITRFTDFDQLLAYAGVHPAERSSGRKGASPETAWHMSKAGNSHLRAAAYRMAVAGVQHNPVIAAHYTPKRAAGKSKMNARGY